MPHLKVTTNCSIDELSREAALSRLGVAVAELLGKSEDYVMISLRDGAAMAFAGSSEPTAYAELESIGFDRPPSELMAELSPILEKTTGAPANRIYVRFTDIERSQYGFNRKTFE